MYDTTQDLAFMLQDAPDSAVASCGVGSCPCTFDQSDELQPTEDGLGFEILGTTVTLQTGSLIGLAVDATVRVERVMNGKRLSVPYKARDIRQIGDGKLTRVKLAAI